MNHRSVPAFRLTLVAAAALAVATPALHAATFEGAIEGNGTVLASSPPDSYVYGYSNSSSYSGYIDGGQSRVSALSAGQSGQQLIETTLTFRQTVINPYDTAQNVSFSFFIPRSQARVTLGQSYATPNLQTYTAAGTMMGDITWGGASVWSMQYGVAGTGSVASGSGTLDIVGPVRSASASGFTISALQGGGAQITTADVWVYDPVLEDYRVESRTGFTGEAYLQSDPYNGLLNLGTIAGHASVDLTYTLKASANFEATYLEDSFSACYGYGCVNVGGYDPFGIDFTPAPNGGGGIDLQFTAAVPEPDSYALMLVGLAVLAWAARGQRSRRLPQGLAG
jgi:hypothetical protein